MSLHQSEWLDDAKRVPVGQKRRVYHGAEITAAMDVWNNEDSWSCYCHRCHQGGKVYKEFLQRADPDIPVYQKLLIPSDLINIGTLAVDHNTVYKDLILLLQSKGVSLVSINELNPMYNTRDKRLVFRFNGVDIGRDCTGRSPAKWLVYNHPKPRGYVYLQGSNAYRMREPVILTEDLFSAQKIRYYTGWSALCLLGTNFKDDTAHFLLDKLAVVATDGDPAGHDAKINIFKRCDLFGIPACHVDVPDGLDPKDMKPDELIQLFKFLES